MRKVNVQQGSAAWLQARVGLITSSRIKDVIVKPKLTKAGKTRGGIVELKGRADYRGELISERLTGRAAEHYVSREMEHGIEQEPFARAAYEVGTDVMVEEVGFVMHPNLDCGGASPDGLVANDGCIEIKCPTTANFIDWKLAGEIPEEHLPQMMWVMACCERDWCDFVAFDPRLSHGLRFFVKRMYRDDKIIAAMELEAIMFNEEIEKAIAKLGGPKWVPQLPKPRSTETVNIGGCDVPRDISDMLDAQELGLVP